MQHPVRRSAGAVYARDLKAPVALVAAPHPREEAGRPLHLRVPPSPCAIRDVAPEEQEG